MPVTCNVIARRGAETARAELVVGDVAYAERRPVCELRVEVSGNVFVAAAADFFEALVGVRGQLEPAGWLLDVYGSSRNVWPSGMCRQMGHGRSAYRMTMGKPALKEDLVNIFETGPDIEAVTVAEQWQFKEEWFASLLGKT